MTKEEFFVMLESISPVGITPMYLAAGDHGFGQSRRPAVMLHADGRLHVVVKTSHCRGRAERDGASRRMRMLADRFRTWHSEWETSRDAQRAGRAAEQGGR